jgi:hypothetical protein
LQAIIGVQSSVNPVRYTLHALRCIKNQRFLPKVTAQKPINKAFQLIPQNVIRMPILSVFIALKIYVPSFSLLHLDF